MKKNNLIENNIIRTADLKYKQDHRWGFKDTYFTLENESDNTPVVFKSQRSDYQFLANKVLPEFRPYAKSIFGIDIFALGKNEEVEKKISEPIINKKFVENLKKKFQKKKYSFSDRDRLVHSHGQTTSDEVYRILYKGKLPRFVDMVFYCDNEKDVVKLIDLAKKNDICLVPYGGGTSVDNALLIPTKEMRMVVSVNMRGMNKIQWLDKKNMTASIEAGINGKELEKKLGELGYTMGHEPDSVEFSTLGGWISTNASGMKRNRYGNIEDIVQNVTMITAEGVLKQVEKFDRVSMGMQPEKMIFGSEGNLGIITKAIVRIKKKPSLKKYESILFKNFADGVGFLKELSLSDIKPASIRLVDNTQFRFGMALKVKSKNVFTNFVDSIKKFFILKIKKFDSHKMCLSTIVMEGSRTDVLYQHKNVTVLAKKHKGLIAGPSNGERGYILTHVIAYIRDFLMDYHCIGETMETTVPWTNIEKVCSAFKKELMLQHKKYKLPAKPFLSYRITQLYHGSVCIYFMFGLYTKGVKKEDHTFALIEKKLREAILKNGGSISHHHGVGKLRKEFVKDTMSKTAIDVLKEIKKSVDSKNIFAIKNNVF